MSHSFQASNPTVIPVDGTLTPEDLELKPAYEITKVLNPTPLQRKFKQDLKYRGTALVLRTGAIPSDMMKVGENQFGKFVAIPVSAWLRRQLDVIEEFITLNMIVPPVLGQGWMARDAKDTPYKKIWDGETMFISLSNWCTFMRQDADYLSEISPNELGDGDYDVAINASGVYYGLHKDNKLASLTMRVDSLLFKPKMDQFDDIIEKILDEESGGTAAKNVKRRRKTKNK